MSRFPMVCTRCGQLTHLAKDCPQRFGKSQQERDFDAMVRQDRAAVLLGAAFFVLALVLFGLLERVPA
jgi:hypothetical protein